MTNVTLWARPTWNTDRWVRDFFGPAAADDWFKGFRPAAEIAKDGDDASFTASAATSGPSKRTATR